MLPFLVFFSNGPEATLPELPRAASPASSGTMKKMIVDSGNVSLDLDLNRLNGNAAGANDLFCCSAAEYPAPCLSRNAKYDHARLQSVGLFDDVNIVLSAHNARAHHAFPS